MSILVTGGAGFIGSNFIRYLNRRGIVDIKVCDAIWRPVLDDLEIDEFFKPGASVWHGKRWDVVFHLGAITDTRCQDRKLLHDNNIGFSRELLEMCTVEKVPFIYASSAATYGKGEWGFSDELPPSELTPLNLYGYSKNSFDVLVAALPATALPHCCVGLKFFNVYGLGEEHKGPMESFVSSALRKIKAGETIKLFKSIVPGMADGAQQRDWVSVQDVCSIMHWFHWFAPRNGLFNVGTGEPRTFTDVVQVLGKALGVEPKVVYVDTPDSLRDGYQSFTCATLAKLRRAGFRAPFATLEQGVEQMVQERG